jgi:hypothetical protein
MVVTIAALVSLGTLVEDSTSLVIGGCIAVFSGLTLIFLEESLFETSDATLPGGSGEVWASRAALGKELGLYLAIGFAAAAVVMENVLFDFFPWHGHGWEAVVMRNSGGPKKVAWRVFGVGVSEAMRWMLMPLFLSKFSAISAAFLDLSTALSLTIYATTSAVGIAATAFATGGMGWWFVSAAGMHPRPLHAVTMVGICGILTVFYVLNARKYGIEVTEDFPSEPAPILSTSQHPIPKLIREAEERYHAMLGRQSKTLEEAVSEYQRRYKMNPPPNFEQWYYFAKKKNVVLIDEYDIIYHSLKPFWGMPPREIRKRARQSMGFKSSASQERNNHLAHAYVRGGEIQTGGQGSDWLKDASREMIQPFVRWLPDMDLAFNIHDEPRVVVPYDALNQYLAKAEAEINQTHRQNPKSASNSFTALSQEEKALPPKYQRTSFNVFAHQSVWTHSIASCPPNSPVRLIDNYRNSKDKHSGQLLGFVVNSTESSEVCFSPSFEHRHGFFDKPNAFSTIERLYPIFSQSKVSSYGDILYPSPWYWTEKVAYDAELDMPWEDKKEKMYWRGSTTGGFSRNGGWRRQHRQRVVSVIDANDTAKILEREKKNGQGNWTVVEVPREGLRELFDVYFSHVGQCDPEDCEEQRHFFDIAPKATQHDAWKWKYLLDVDGNAFSGRYHAFLRSNSVVLKLAIFREWHDEWLHPWIHYIPLSLELEEVAETMRFFRYEPEGDKYAKRIADESKRWANHVLRKEDLEVWFFRLLLE